MAAQLSIRDLQRSSLRPIKPSRTSYTAAHVPLYSAGRAGAHPKPSILCKSLSRHPSSEAMIHCLDTLRSSALPKRTSFLRPAKAVSSSSASSSSSPTPSPYPSASYPSLSPKNYNNANNDVLLQSDESRILWAGFSASQERIGVLEEKVVQLEEQLKQAAAAMGALATRTPPKLSTSALHTAYSAVFLMSFLGFVNLIGALCTWLPHVFVPVAAKGTGFYSFVKVGVPALVPYANSAVVLTVILLAVRIAWRSLHWD